jgi:outer membrane protein TolC
MKKALLIALGLLAAGMSAGMTDSRLRDYLREAEANNLEMQVAKKSLEESGARKTQALAGLLPTVSLSSTALQNDKGVSLKLSDDAPAITMKPKKSTDTKLEVNQVLFSPGSYYSFQVQRKAHEAAGYEYTATLDDLRMQVVEGYYSCMQATELVGMRQSALDLAAENLKLTSTLREVGKIPETDLLRAQVGEMSARQELRTANDQAELARNSFNRLLGRPLTASATFDTLGIDALLNGNPRAEFAPVADAEESVQEALANRAEIKRLSAGLRSLSLANKAVLSGYLPSLIFVGDYGYSATDFHYTDDEKYWTVMGVLQWNLFTGFSTTARVREARAQLRQFELNSANTNRLIELEVRNARLTYLSDLDQFDVARSTYIAAQSNYTMVRKQYENSLASMVTLTDAKSVLDSSRANLVVTYYNALISGTRYQKGIGNPVWANIGDSNE